MVFAYALILLFAGAGAPPRAAGAPDARLMFERALILEETQDRWEEAIDLYRRIVDESADGALAAQAQLRIGICYQSLGMAEARQAFRTVIERFPEHQRAVAEARSRLDQLEALIRAAEEARESATFRRIRIPLALRPGQGGFHFSPDGSRLAFAAGGDLWVMPARGEVESTTPGTHGDIRDLLSAPHDPRVESTSVPGTPERLTDGIGAYGPVSWSGDGEWIAFNAEREGQYGVYVIPSAGGTPQPVPIDRDPGPIRNGLRLSLSHGGDLLAYSTRVNRPGPLDYAVHLAAVAGGRATEIAGSWSVEPAFSPDGRRIAFMKGYPSGAWPKERSELWVWSPDESRMALEIEGPCWSPVWSPDAGRIALLCGAAPPSGPRTELWVAPADPDGRASPPARIDLPFVTEQFLAGWTPDGEIAVLNHKADHNAVYTVPASGGMATQVTPSGGVNHPRWTPDGNAIVLRWGRGAIAMVPRDGGRLSILPGLEEAGVVEATAGGGNEVSPDGRLIAFSGYGPERPIAVHIYTVPVEGGDPVRITFGPRTRQDRFPSWSPDGHRIAFLRTGPEGSEIWVVPAAGGAAERVTTSAHNVAYAGIRWSPDGRFIACFSGDGAVQIVPVDGGPARKIVEIEGRLRGHNELAWSPDGSRLVYADGGGIWVVPAEGGVPREIRTGVNARASNLDWSPDGETIVFQAASSPEPELWLAKDFPSPLGEP